MSDVGKVILCNVVSIISFILVGAIINYTTKTSQNPITFQFWFGLMIGTIILALQVMMRFTIRITYSYLSQTVQSAKKNAFILGSDREAVLLAQTIREEAEGQYKPIAYISDNETHVGKTVDGLPVLFSNVSTEEIKKQMKKYNAQTLLLYRKQIDMFDKEFFDNCIYADVELILVNPYKTSKWREDTSKVSKWYENGLDDYKPHEQNENNSQSNDTEKDNGKFNNKISWIQLIQNSKK
jgi:FlaA1/EpsC-like NDP-sugar epimerase